MKSLDRILVTLAIVILIINYPINRWLFSEPPDTTGTFITLILICVVLFRLIDRDKK
jgi:O-antigen/teichoic acid export membrane protein